MQPYDFSLRQIQYAVAVAELRSFRRAAERCHVSQPSLSSQIAEVEVALGVQLFERDRRGVMITAAGSEIVERMQRVLVEADDVSKAAQRFLDPLAGTLRIGVIPTIGPYLLPVASPLLREELPRLSLNWLEDKTEALVRRILHGDLDGAFLALESPIGDLRYETIRQDPFVLAMPPSHRLGDSTAPIPFSRVRGEHILLLDEGHCLRDQVIEYCSERGFEQLSVRATSLPTLVQMACANMGITLLPGISVPIESRRSGLVTRPFKQPAPHRTIILGWRRQSALTKAMRKIAETVRSAV